jgi:hypothetical protein
MANLNAGKSRRIAGQALPDMQGMTQPLAAAMAECSEVCTKSFAEWQEEIARFAQARMQRNGEVAEAAARCRDVNDFIGLQQEWLKTASQDYLQETARIMGLASRMTQDWMQPMTRFWGNGGWSHAAEPKAKD